MIKITEKKDEEIKKLRRINIILVIYIVLSTIIYIYNLYYSKV